MFNFVRKIADKVKVAVVAFVMALTMPVLAHAEAVDFTSLTTSVDFASAIAAILLVFAAIAGVGVAFKGGRLVLKALGIS